MKLMIIGYARSGKDHMAEYLNANIQVTHTSSSLLASQIFIFDKLKFKYGYTSAEDCFADRFNHRAEWYDLITRYNTPDYTKLAAQIFNINNCYVGMRDYQELQACKAKWDDLLVIWVDASDRIPPEDADSCTIQMEQADIIIENNGSVQEFNDKLNRLCWWLG